MAAGFSAVFGAELCVTNSLRSIPNATLSLLHSSRPNSRNASRQKLDVLSATSELTISVNVEKN